jgi:basic membrane protein A
MTSRKPHLIILALLAALALFAAGCGDDAEDTEDTVATDATTEEEDGEETSTTEADEETTTEPTEEEAEGDGEAIRIALVTPSATNDVAFSQSMADALAAIGETVTIDLDTTDNQFVVEDAAAVIRGYADDGYDLVIAHGSQYGALVEEIAPDFPEVSFAWGTETNTFDLDNVFAYTVRSDEGGYVMGALAAELSESGTLGVVGPVDVGDAALYVDGFEAGAAAQNPDINVAVTWTDSFSDVALASEAATAHIGNGADALTGSAQMVTGATGVAAEEGVPWFGTQANQTSLAEEVVVASQVYHWEVILAEMLAMISEGTLGGEVFTLTLDNGGLVVEYNDAFDLPEEIQALGEDTTAGIADGSITTGV